MLTVEQVQAWEVEAVSALGYTPHPLALRRMAARRFWPEDRVRAAEQAARLGEPALLAEYDADCAVINQAILL